MQYGISQLNIYHSIENIHFWFLQGWNMVHHVYCGECYYYYYYNYYQGEYYFWFQEECDMVRCIPW